MSVMLSVLGALYAEINEARAQCWNVLHVRVASDAIRGSVTTVAITPERARTLAALEVRGDETVEVAMSRTLSMREILVHPEDWNELLKEAEPQRDVTPTSVFGLPVVV